MRVLLIEDDDVIADLIRSVVVDEGWVCAVAQSERDLPAAGFDVIVTDLLARGAYSRAEVVAWLEHLAEVYPRTPIVIVTAHAAILGDAQGLSAHRVIMKPFEIDELVEAIRGARPGGSHIRKTP